MARTDSIIACITNTDRERFWSKVAKAGPDDCWPWTTGRFRHGYGMFSVRTFPLQAHRIAWILTSGLIPPGLCVCHRCDNPQCCNPSHLWLGTNAENTQDRSSKGRDGSCPGERNSQSKVTTVDVPIIRNRVRSGERLASVAADYGITKEAVWAISSRRTWKHVD